jgi:hypothetical protein
VLRVRVLPPLREAQFAAAHVLLKTPQWMAYTRPADEPGTSGARELVDPPVSGTGHTEFDSRVPDVFVPFNPKGTRGEFG